MADDLSSIINTDKTVTRGAGLMRFDWSDVIAMSEAGLFGELDRPELIDGEIFIMPFEGPLHRHVLQILQRWLFSSLGSTHELSIRASLQVIGSTTYFIPDLAVMPNDFLPSNCDVPTAALIIEVSDTTLKFDLITKLKFYAKAGAKEYWVVDTKTRTVIVHREPNGESFGSVQTFRAGQLACPLCLDGAGFDPATLPDPADFD
jgi:Uma2 family endonuclease